MKFPSVTFMLLVLIMIPGVVNGSDYSSAAAVLLDRIALGEGTSDAAAQAHGLASAYDITYAYGLYNPKDARPLTEMTIKEVKQLQQQMLANQAGNKLQSSAVGKYQLISTTLEEQQKTLGLSDDTKFDATTQELFGLSLLEKKGYREWAEGKISDYQFQKNIAKEWASVADPDTGTSDYGQGVGTTDAQIKEAMTEAKSLLGISREEQKPIIALTLYVHDGSTSGPKISGAQVKGHDGSGNSFQQIANDEGYVSITGTPGTWSLSVSANGYETNGWNQDITGNCIKHAYILPTNAAVAGASNIGPDANNSTQESSRQVSSKSSAQSTNQPRIAWRKTYGGDYQHSLRAGSVQQTSDGGYMIASDDCTEAKLIRTDADGNMLWEKNYGGPEETEQVSSVFLLTSDGGYIIVGSTWTINGNQDALLVKTDSTGNVIWDKAIEGPASEGPASELALAIQQTNDGGYIIIGITNNGKESNLWLVKVDSNGNKLWDRTFDFGGTGIAGYEGNMPFVQQTNDGGYILSSVFTVEGLGNAYALLVKTDAEGNMLWNKTYIDKEYASSVQQTSDGGYIFAGWKGVKVGDTWIDLACLTKTDPLGNEVWNKTFEEGYVAKIVRQTNDGGYILAGNARDTIDTAPVLLIKTDPSGNKEWYKKFGAHNWDQASSIQQTSDGGYIIVGDDGYEIWLVKIGGNEEANSTKISPIHRNESPKQEINAGGDSAKNQSNTQEKPVSAKSSGFGGVIAIASLLCAFIMWRKN